MGGGVVVRFKLSVGSCLSWGNIQYVVAIGVLLALCSSARVETLFRAIPRNVYEQRQTDVILNLCYVYYQNRGCGGDFA